MKFTKICAIAIAAGFTASAAHAGSSTKPAGRAGKRLVLAPLDR